MWGLPSWLEARLAQLDRFLEWKSDQRPILQVAVGIAPLFALGFGAIFGTIALWEWSHVRGWPVEQAEVVAAVRTGDEDHCGKSSWADVYTLTWASRNPPPGLPAEFSNEEGCDRSEVGDVVEIVRVVSDSGKVHVWDEPVTSLGFAFVLIGVGLTGGYALGFVAGGIQVGWVAWRGRRTDD